MKNPLRIFAIAFILTRLCTAIWAAEVVIPDGVLKSAIWATLGKPEPVGTLTAEDMLSLTDELNADYECCVRSLDGLGAAQNLRSLGLFGNDLGSLTFPSGLTSLTELNLSDSHLTSLVLPADLTNLTSLYLDGNQLTNLTLPAGLTSLTTLALRGSHLPDFSSLRVRAKTNSDFWVCT